jgi:uncharacterized protein
LPGVVGADGQHDTAADEVGLVAGTEDSTPLQFAVTLDEASYLQLDDVIVTVRDLPGGGHVATSGIVTQVRASHEGAGFGSDVFLISDGVSQPSHLVTAGPAPFGAQNRSPASSR